MEGLGVGRIVHYNPGADQPCHAAIVTKVVRKDEGMVNLTTFYPGGGTRDCHMVFADAGMTSADVGAPETPLVLYTSGTWHWPERE